jgi:hypothetical protein
MATGVSIMMPNVEEEWQLASHTRLLPLGLHPATLDGEITMHL